MKTIRILKMALDNFKCHEHLVINFDGENTSIYGDNATGKTTIYDALTWVLFGRDSLGNGERNMEVKPLGTDGKPLDETAITSVEITLDVNGSPVRLRREYKGVFSCKRGCSEPTFDGNTSAYYFNGVPYQQGEYKTKVSEIVDEEKFKLLTSVSYFANELPWQKRRDTLCEAANLGSDFQIMQTDKRFVSLAVACKDKSVDELKKEMLAEKKAITKATSSIPERIDELTKMANDLEQQDFAGAKREIERLADEMKQENEKYEEKQKDLDPTPLWQRIHELQMTSKSLDSENELFRAKQESGSVNVETTKSDIGALEMAKKLYERKMSVLEQRIADAERDVEEYRNLWIKKNAEEFMATKCPTCGRELPEESLKKARAEFEKNKQATLAQLVKTAEVYKKSIESYMASKDDFLTEIGNTDEKINLLQSLIESQKASTVTDMDGYSERKEYIDAEIKRIQSEIESKSLQKKMDKINHDTYIDSTNKKIEAQRTIAAAEASLKTVNERIEALEDDEAKQGERLGEVESYIYLIEEFSRYKASFVEDIINSMFSLATFRLFREQANGGLEERCDVVLNGVPYSNVNNGARINLGVDIINTLSSIYNVSVPLFIDNAEAVTKLQSTTAQVIRLVVDENEKEIKVK